MNRRSIFALAIAFLAAGCGAEPPESADAGIAADMPTAAMTPAPMQTDGERVYELRTYTSHPGKLDALLARFRNHTVPLFEKHGMTNEGYWVPRDTSLAENTLIYILSYPSAEAREASWEAFRADPAWIEARAASEADGPINQSVTSILLEPTDFSPMQ